MNPLLQAMKELGGSGVDTVIGSGLFAQLPTSVQDRLMDNAQRLSAEPTDISEIVTDITRNDAPTTHAPTLVLTGDQSPKMFLVVSQELARSLPHAEQAQIGGASHVLHGMNPPVYNATALAFLAKHAV